ncbi:MAG: ribonuclease P protein component 1 [Candidatus Aenigmatarchaeota archaeon]
MPIDEKNLVRHELIGLRARITRAENKQLIGTEGRVVDESRNTLTLETAGKEKSFAKAGCTFEFRIPSGQRVRVDGKLLVARPEDRIKKKLPRW